MAEKGQFGLAFSSGSATTATIVSALPKGAHIVSVSDVYGGTYRFFTKVGPTLGHETTFVDLANPQSLLACLRPETRLVWIETPTNPTLRLVDIAQIAQIIAQYNQQNLRPCAHGTDATFENQIILVVDNTFMSPYFQQPLTLGADLVVHSVTKYINGHSDCVMGMAVTNYPSLYEKLKFLQNSIGAVPSAFDCFLANRGFKTLHLRMQQHAINAMAVVQCLSTSPYVEKVIYPGLPSHPQHELAKRQAKGFGGMVTFYIKGNLASANSFLKATKLFTLAESLGGVESLAELPAVMTHGSVSPADRLTLGISDTLLRLSVGIEDTQDLVNDVQQALHLAMKENNLI
jgi:cystathionine gamma-lyase